MNEALVQEVIAAEDERRMSLSLTHIGRGLRSLI